jgi:tripartite motif-containing protein 71
MARVLYPFLLLCFIVSALSAANKDTKMLQLKFLFAFGQKGKDPGEFLYPSAISADPAGNIYVADTGNNRIQKFDSKGNLLAFDGGFGWANGQFQRPADISAINGLDVFVADYENRRIERYDKDLNWINSFRSSPDIAENLSFGFVSSVAVSIHGELFLLDAENKKIVKFNSSREPVLSFGDYNWGEGALTEPARLFVSRDDKVYVTDQKAARIAIYDYYGNWLGFLGESILQKPFGICVAANGVIFVSDIAGNEILAFDTSGKIILRAGSAGNQYGAFASPCGVTLYKNMLFVADTDNHRVQVFELEFVEGY